MAETDDTNLPAELLNAVKPGMISAVKARAIAAVRHLVGAYVPDVLAHSQDAKDERDARTLFKLELAKAAAAKAASNPEMVERMVNRLAEREFRIQENLEETARLAIEYLPSDSASAGETASESDAGPAEVNADWLHTFTDYAGKASDEGVRDIWARVLAGEIRKPGAVSLRTLQLLSVIDQPTAEAFKALLPWIYSNRWLPHEALKHLPFAQVQLLRDEGLIGSLDTDIRSTVTFQEGPWAAVFGDVGVFVDGEPGTTMVFQCNSISRIARELTVILPRSPEPRAPRLLFDLCVAQSTAKRVRLGPVVSKGDSVLMPNGTVWKDWTRPE